MISEYSGRNSMGKARDKTADSKEKLCLRHLISFIGKGKVQVKESLLFLFGYLSQSMFCNIYYYYYCGCCYFLYLQSSRCSPPSIIYFLKKNFNLCFYFMCMGICLHVWAPCPCSAQVGQKRAVDPLRLEVQMVVSFQMDSGNQNKLS